MLEDNIIHHIREILFSMITINPKVNTKWYMKILSCRQVDFNNNHPIIILTLKKIIGILLVKNMFLKIKSHSEMMLSKEIQAISMTIMKLERDKELKGFRYQKILLCQKETLKAKPTIIMILLQGKDKNWKNIDLLMS